MRLRRLAIMGVALAPVVGMAATADAGDGNARHWKRVHVTVTPSGPGFSFVDSFCDQTQPDICVFMLKYPEVAQSGDLVGTSIEGDTSVTSASGLSVVAVTGSFAGTVKGCGTGTFLYSGRGTLDANLQGTLNYQIAPGTGTGDLAGITGTFETTTGDPTISGVLRCQRR
jgi:hypothetical protein